MKMRKRKESKGARRMQKLTAYAVSREAAVRYGEGVVATDETFANSYRLDGVKRVRPVKRKPFFPEQVLYEITFKKRGK